MRIDFEDKSYVDLKNTDDGKIVLIISAKDHDNPLKRITNAVELSIDEFKKLISDARK